MVTRNFRTITVLLLSLTLLLSACQAAPEGPALKISGVWGRPSPAMAEAGAVYMLIENTGSQADKLIAASSPASQVAEIHESFMEDEVMKMRPVEGGLEIPAGGSVELKPGSYHIMLIMLTKPLTAGEKIDLVLTFENAGEMPVQAEIRME